MKLIIVLPDNNYFLWQMLVQMNNFRKFGYENDTIYLIGKNTGTPSSTLLNIMRNGKTKSNFYIYNDERKYPKYSSSLRPHILAKFFEQNPVMEKETFFYLDPDVIFTKKIRFNDLEKNKTWYLSDTRSYINSDYIKSKGQQLFYEMCKIVGINPELVEKNDNNAGGAQYFLKNVNAEFWRKVEKDSEELYQHMVNTSEIYNPEHPIQVWTADMWAVLWNAWFFGHETKIIKRLNFAWATDNIVKWDKVSIFHNAGAVINNGEFFLKTNYQTSPFNKKLSCNKKFCSRNYIKEIKETEKNFSKILF